MQENNGQEKETAGSPRMEEYNGDVSCKIALSPDAHEAFAIIHGLKGVPVDPQIIYDALVAEQINIGIDEQAIAELASENGARGDAIAVARGKKPVAGENAEIIYHFDTKPKPKVIVNKDGKVDFRETGMLQLVHEEDVLAEKKQATEGIPGVTVTGKEISCKPGKDFQIKKGVNTYFADDGESRLISEITGFVQLSRYKEVEVSETYIVDGDIDLKSGNVSFHGNVIINGDVKTGFKVVATKNVEVRGLVEDAQIHCGGDLTVRGGFIGTGKGNIRAGGETRIRFMENQNLVCNGDVYIAEEIIHSRVISGGSIFVKYGKGAIIGGEVWAAGKIEAKLLGNFHYAQTKLYAGYRPGIVKMEKEMKKVLLQSETTKNIIAKAVSSLVKKKYKTEGLSPDMEQTLNKLYEYNFTFDEVNGELKTSFEEITNERERLRKEAYVQSTQHVYPGVSIKIDDALRLLDEEFDNKRFIYADGMINAI